MLDEELFGGLTFHELELQVKKAESLSGPMKHSFEPINSLPALVRKVREQDAEIWNLQDKPVNNEDLILEELTFATKFIKQLASEPCQREAIELKEGNCGTCYSCSARECIRHLDGWG